VTTDDPLAWLREQLQEQRSSATRWVDRRCDGCGREVASRGAHGLVYCTSCVPGDLPLTPSVVADIDAKLALLDEHRFSQLPTAPEGYGICPTCDQGPPPARHVRWPCKTVKLLASPLASLPGFPDELRLP
jgi:hypothetical protein